MKTTRKTGNTQKIGMPRSSGATAERSSFSRLCEAIRLCGRIASGEAVRHVTSFALLLLFTAFFSLSYAEVPWFEAGIVGDKLLGGDYEYQEYTFVTGEPILLRGTLKVKQPVSILEAKGPFSVSYDFELQSEDESIQISRKIKFDVRFEKDASLDQIKVERKIKSFNESILTPAGQFTLGKYNSGESRIMDLTPSGAYTFGNGFMDRTFYLNGNAFKNAGTLHITSKVSPILAYENLYAKNESFVVTHIYDFKPSAKEGGKEGEEEGGAAGGGSETAGEAEGDAAGAGFGGEVVVGLSSLEKTIFSYERTDPQSISFYGGFFKYKNQENVLEAKYDLQKGSEKKKSVVRLKGKVVTETEALNLPMIRDMGGMPTEQQAKQLTALGIFAPDRVYFSPHLPISKHEFAKAVYIAIKGELPAPKKNEIAKRRRPGVETPFLDISIDHPDYHYIESYKAEGLVNGRSRYLMPDVPITKAEALTILLRTTGLDRKAPNPPYKTTFADDAKIPEWAKDIFYTALEINLLGGEDTQILAVRTDDGLYANPTEIITREQAVVMIDRLIRHLNQEMIPDYREKILKR